MKIEKLRLKGFTGIKRGLGLDEIEIDFKGISGLIAFEGDNGSGKTTVLENLHPFNQLASREGALFHHVDTRDAEKELCFSYAGHHYRTLVKIDCQSEKQEGYIWRDGKPEVNGKISQYAKYMKELLGSPELFFSSVFCAQGSKKLSEMTTGQLKGLFAEFLRLERYQKWEDTAKQAGNVLQGKAGQLDARIKALTEQIAGKDDLDAKYLVIGQKIAFLQDDKTICLDSLAENRKTIDELKETISKNALQIARKADIGAAVVKLAIDKDTEKRAAEAEIESLKAKYRELAAEAKKHESVLQDEEAIKGAAGKEKEIQGKIDQLVQEIEEISESLSLGQNAAHALEKEIQELKSKIGQIAKDIINPERCSILVSLKAQASSLKGKMADLNRKDPACQSIACSFIKGALDAEKELPEIEKQIVAREAEILESSEALKAEKAALVEKNNEKVEAYHGAREVLQAGQSALDDKRKALAALRYDILKIKELAAKAPIVEVAEARKADLEKQMAEVTEQGKAKREAINKRIADFDLEIDAKRVEIEECERSIEHSAECRLKALATEIEKIEKVDLPAIEKEIQGSREKIATLQAELAKITDAGKELEQVQKDRDALIKNISQWRYLQAACGKNGLQALEIDGTAPLITGFANDLLSQAFGPLFSVKLVTQDEDGKECLDILVLTEDGEEILLENLSGGQKTWILMALRLAMTLLSKEKSGRNFETFFSDELDGALDPENALNFIGMYRAFMAAGSFSSGLFISHKPSCRNMADNILVFESGKNPYWG